MKDLNEEQSISQVVDNCKLHWIFSQLPQKIIAEMELELTGHLEEAVREGKTLEKVVGKDINYFARTWAEPHYEPKTFKKKIRDLLYILLLALMITFPIGHIQNMSLHVPVDWSTFVTVLLFFGVTKLLITPGVITRIMSGATIFQFLKLFVIFSFSTAIFAGLIFGAEKLNLDTLFYWPWQASLLLAGVTFTFARHLITKESREKVEVEDILPKKPPEVNYRKLYLILCILVISLLGSIIVWQTANSQVAQMTSQFFTVCLAIILWNYVLTWPPNSSREK